MHKKSTVVSPQLKKIEVFFFRSHRLCRQFYYDGLYNGIHPMRLSPRYSFLLWLYTNGLIYGLANHVVANFPTVDVNEVKGISRKSASLSPIWCVVATLSVRGCDCDYHFSQDHCCSCSCYTYMHAEEISAYARLCVRSSLCCRLTSCHHISA